MSHPPQIISASALKLFIGSMTDIPDVIGAVFGAAGLILTESDVTPAFFDLRSGLAGELFQKITNYDLRLALVVVEPAKYGERFGELMYEHRQHRAIRFFDSQASARAWLETD
jgi:Domain of unknown function (DUF4180)